MDHAVAASDVGLHQAGVGEADSRVADLDAEALAVERGGVGHADDLSRLDAARDHVVGEDVPQRRAVLGLHQALERASRQLGEGRIGRRKDGEGALAGERVAQTGDLDGCGKGLELARRGGGFQDRLGIRLEGSLGGLGGLGGFALGLGGRGEQRAGGEEDENGFEVGHDSDCFFGGRGSSRGRNGPLGDCSAFAVRPEPDSVCRKKT